MTRWRYAAPLALLAAIAATTGMVLWSGAGAIGADIWRALPALPAATAVHAIQLTCSGLGWWYLLPRPRAGIGKTLRVRWVREAVNTTLPLAGFGGAVAATRMLSREAGLTMADATASTTADLTTEAIALPPFLALAIALIAILAPGTLTQTQAALAVLPLLAGTAGFVLAQRMGLLRVIERLAARFGFGAAMAGLHDGMMALHARGGAVAASIALHFLAWALGGAEVWVILGAIGHPVGWGQAVAIEGLGMAARSLGFALPSGLAAQEAGFVLACGLFGIAAPDALALSMVKRLRELVVGIAGTVVWQVGAWQK